MDIKNGAKISSGSFGAGRSFSYDEPEDGNSVLSALIQKQNLSKMELQKTLYRDDLADCLDAIADLIEKSKSILKHDGWVKPGKVTLFLRNWSTNSRKQTKVIVDQYRGSRAFEMLNHPSNFKETKQGATSTAVGDALARTSFGAGKSFDYANDVLKRKAEMLKSASEKNKNKMM